ncbi:hypothetical protein [Achromobacter sp. UMC71]|uniref:hypothetical protein n=1 Tax=Achromobacter sp. UMC71 TaxID=1862320 RepID=UPI00160440D4|nr:hypothetical protein [Achromobacter sp. UMC71]MBB1627681.1 hypothetical protein [Achromobacter sp. UMC71]
MHEEDLPGDRVNIDDLKGPITALDTPWLDAQIEALPLHGHLSPDNFERLIYRIAAQGMRDEMQAYRYGGRGSTQGGIDVIVLDPSGNRHDVYEAKRVQSISKGDMTKWVEKFLNGKHASRAKRYVLCTTFLVEQDTGLLDEWISIAECLGERGIGSELMHGARIQEWLKRRREIVVDMFGEAAAKRFCVPGPSEFSPPEAKSFRRRYVGEHGRLVAIENVTVRCEIMMPALDEPSVTSVVSFARSDLRGVSIQLSASEIVRWCQWRSHAEPTEERPYAVDCADGSGNYVFLAHSARFMLEKEEVLNLDWVFTQGWALLIDCARAAIHHWRCLPFDRIPSASIRPVYALASVDRDFWSSTLAFARAHRAGDGDSVWHIFDTAHHHLKVYSDSSSTLFDPGYHAILYAYNNGTMWTTGGRHVLIGWSRIDLRIGEPDTLDPRRVWDATYTHDWLFDQLFPRVIEWLGENRAPRAKTLMEKIGRHTPIVPRRHETSEFAISYAEDAQEYAAVPGESLQSLLHCVTALQRHFACSSGVVPHEAALWQSILVATARVARYATHLDERYIRSNIGLRADAALVPALQEAVECGLGAVGHFAVELALRSLIAVLESCKSLPRADLSFVASKLQCVLDRRNEDLVCDHLCK